VTGSGLPPQLQVRSLAGHGPARITCQRHTHGVIDQNILCPAIAAALVCAGVVFYVQKRNRQPSPRRNVVAVDFHVGLARMDARRVATTDIDPVRVAATITFTITDHSKLRQGDAVALMEGAILREVDGRINAMSGMAAIVRADEMRASLMRALAVTQRCGITVTEVELHLEGPGGEQSGNPPTRFIA